MTHTDRVLSDLKRCTRRGISLYDYPQGFALRSRVSDLRARGHIIHGARDGDKPTFRYWYQRGPK